MTEDMARIVKEDFDELISFINSYSLSALTNDRDFVAFLSTIHKKFYSYLVLIEELRLCIDENSKKPVLTRGQFDYLQESVSDCGQCLFLAINGCYKGTKLLLRSSIENFLKGISLDVVPQIITEKSVYQVFDDADAVDVFQKTNLKDELHNIYGDLCMDAHTADNSHMAAVSAMKYFPHFDRDNSKRLASVFIKLLPIFVTALCLKYNIHYHSVNYQNKEVISANLINEYRGAIFGE